VCCSQKLQKKSPKTPFWGFKVIDVNKIKKPVTSACNDKQTCLHLSAIVFTLEEPIAAK